jgi:acyl carrier protein
MMGLDIVEMVMEVERAFGIQIADADAGKLRTVGDLHAYIRDHVPGAAEDRELWERLVDVIHRESGAPRERIRPESSFVEDLRME